MIWRGGSAREGAVSKGSTPSLRLAPSRCVGFHGSAGRCRGSGRERLGLGGPRPLPAGFHEKDSGPEFRGLLELAGVDSLLKFAEMLAGSTFQGRK